MYPAGEVYTQIASAAFRDALLDANMLQPSSVGTGLNPLFPPTLMNIVLGGDDNLFGSKSAVEMTKFLPTITIGLPYGTEQGYAGDTYKDVEIFIPFTTWQRTGGTEDVLHQKLEFARDHRQNVFSAHGLIILGGVVRGRPRPASPVTSLDAVDYAWRFHYSRA